MANYLTLADRKIFNRLFLQFTLIFGVLFFSLTKLQAQSPILLEKYILDEGMENTEYLQTLLYDNVPAILIRSGGIQEVRSGFPQRASVDASDLGSVANSEDIFRTVKLLQVNLTKEQDKSGLRLNPDMLKNFFNLYYVLINSTIPLTQEEVSAMVSGFEEGQYIFLFTVNSIM
ncbi:hypothetical protein [Aquiflexum lacus]|uniref:hypothetical protein n=1 Tax=Aquiflexum lacus TaxID=2483805 RepID=UPI0018937641|nr:hypothetical protein [Aquiflexum lacus]